MARTNKPIIVSTGMHTTQEIEQTVSFLRDRYSEFTLLHTNSTYPTPYSDVNLGYVRNLEKISEGVIGYSGHERGYHICLAAVALGAAIIEKHYTFDRNLEGNDHKVSLLPDELKLMCEQIDDIVEAASDRRGIKKVSQGERLNKISLSKSAYLNFAKEAGQIINETDISFKAPCVGLTPSDIRRYFGRPLTVSKKAGDPLLRADFIEDSGFPDAISAGQVGLL